VLDSATIELRNLRVKDYVEFKKSMVQVYSAMSNSYWSKADISTLVKKFPRWAVLYCDRW